MPFLRDFALENFRVFQDQEKFDFHPITILTGPNSSGKSSVIAAIKFFSNLFNQDVKTGFTEEVVQLLIGLNHIHHDLIDARFGDFSKLIHIDKPADQIKLTLPAYLRGIKETFYLELAFGLTDSRLKQGQLQGLRWTTQNENEVASIQLKNNRWHVSVCYDFFYSAFVKEYNTVHEYYKLYDKLKELDPQNYGLEEATGLRMRNLKGNDFTELEISERYSEEEKATIRQMVQSLMDLHPRFFREHLLFTRYADHIYGPDSIFTRPQTHYTRFFKIPGQDKHDTSQELVSFPNAPLRFKYFVDFDTDVNENNFIELYIEHPFFRENDIHSFGEFVTSMQAAEASIFNKLSFSIDNQDDYYTILNAFSYLSNIPYLFNEIQFRYSDSQDIDIDNIKGNLVYKFNAVENFSLSPFLDKPVLYEVFFEEFIHTNLRNSVLRAGRVFNDINFLSSSRSVVKRTYSTHQEDSEFHRLINFYLKNNLEKSKAITDFMNKYLKVFGIGEELLIEPDKEGSQSYIYIVAKEQRTLVADLGYGISQVLPILFKIAQLAYPNKDLGYQTHMNESSVLCIEEPESGLHPALQSLLADLFWDAARSFNIQFIIETHSEYLIRKMQYLTAKKNDDSNTIIYYFMHPDAVDENNKRVREIKILSNGSLSQDFGPGFYDESDKIAIELFNLQHSRKN